MKSGSEHYRSHLAPIYLWAAGGFDVALKLAEAELDALLPELPRGAQTVDLGCGFGAHAIALVRRGCEVTAVDSSQTLLDELRSRAPGPALKVIEADLLEFAQRLEPGTHAVICMGDTLTHLPSLASVEQLLARAAGALAPRGRFVATFRDYTSARLEEDRFILVRSDADRLLSCFLEYAAEHVNVHDVLHEKHAGAWQMRVSAYRKLRLSPDRIGEALGAHGLVVNVDRAASGMVRVVATRN